MVFPIVIAGRSAVVTNRATCDELRYIDSPVPKYRQLCCHVGT